MPRYKLNTSLGVREGHMSAAYARRLAELLERNTAIVRSHHFEAREEIVLHHGIYWPSITIGHRRIASGVTYDAAWDNAAHECVKAVKKPAKKAVKA